VANGIVPGYQSQAPAELSQEHACEGAGIGISVPVKNPAGSQGLDIDTRTRNALLRGLPFQGERGLALLTQRWAALQHTTASPRQLTQVAPAPPSSSPNSSTNTSGEVVEINSMACHAEIRALCEPGGREIRGQSRVVV
jgi:hypothetical protein